MFPGHRWNRIRLRLARQVIRRAAGLSRTMVCQDCVACLKWKVRLPGATGLLKCGIRNPETASIPVLITERIRLVFGIGRWILTKS